MNQNKLLRDLIDKERIKQLATPANYIYGKAIFKRGGVELIDQNHVMIEARVGGLDGTVKEGGSQRRRTRLYIKNGTLAWHCAGNPKNHDIFCKHCVAIALKIIS